MDAGVVVEREIARVEAQMFELCLPPGTGDMAAAIQDHLGAGGKRFRARLALDAGFRLGLAPGERVALASASELLHNASLVHDDIQDGDTDRRGRLAVWVHYGRGVAICVGDLFLSAAYAALAQSGGNTAELLAHVHGRVASVIGGQTADLRAAPAASDPDTYCGIAGAKSGGLLGLPLELALLAAGRREALAGAAEAARQFAVGYQIADDLADSDRDRLQDQLNIVAVLTAAGEPAPAVAAAELAIARFDAAITAARALPNASATLLSRQARTMRVQVAASTPAVSA